MIPAHPQAYVSADYKTFVLRRMDVFESHHWAHLYSAVRDEAFEKVCRLQPDGSLKDVDVVDVACELYPKLSRHAVQAYLSLGDPTEAEFWDMLKYAPTNHARPTVTTENTLGGLHV